MGVALKGEIATRLVSVKSPIQMLNIEKRPNRLANFQRLIRVDNMDDSVIIGSAGQIQIFVLPDLTAGHIDTQGGTERMPDLVTAFDIKREEEN